jgi:transcriptional regulator with XRE-family HTH domain
MHYERLARQLLRALRGKRSQVAFSRRLGFRTNVAYAWESGRRWPTGAMTLRAAERARIDVRAALRRFFASPPGWLDRQSPGTAEAVAALLSDLRGSVPIVDVARRCGRSRYAVARWLTGGAEPRLPDFLRMIEATSLRLLDFVALFVDPDELPAARDAWRVLQAHRRAAYDLPWIPAVARAIELADYAALPRHERGWIAAALGIGVEEEERCLQVLADSGQIRWSGRRWEPDRVLTVDTGQDPGAERRLKSFWAEVGLDRLRAGDPGLFSFNVFTVSKVDLERLRDLHRSYFQSMRAIIAESEPAERVVVANVQLFALATLPEAAAGAAAAKR